MDPEVLLKALPVHQEFWSFCVAVKLCQEQSPISSRSIIPQQAAHVAGGKAVASRLDSVPKSHSLLDCFLITRGVWVS